jgi:outer membrane receptor protein involved in Fe transport
VDEVGYAFPITAKGASLDLQRVEVLKGPQGTLFGQNSTGGAVNYIAAKPTPDFSAGIYSSLNNYGRLQVGGHVGGGLTDTLTVRVSGEATEGGPGSAAPRAGIVMARPMLSRAACWPNGSPRLLSKYRSTLTVSAIGRIRWQPRWWR